MKMHGSAIILAGGASRRMGRDKAELPWNDTTLLDHTAAQMTALFDDVLVVSGIKQRTAPGTRSLQDHVFGGGPMAGLIAGLEQMIFPWAFVMACDMPWVEPEMVRTLWSLTGKDHQAVIPISSGQRQTLAACYSRKALPNGRVLWDQGERSLQKWADALSVHWVSEWELRSVDPSLRSFTNINTPEEFAVANLSTERDRLAS